MSKPLQTLILLILASCGGRPANLISETNDYDHQLTCTHIGGEYEMNLSKIRDITKEKSIENGNNIGLLLIAPMFIDLSDTERKEVEALHKRNEHLIKLSENRICDLKINQTDNRN